METATQQIKDLKNPIYIFFKSIITFIVLILIFVSPFFVYADDEDLDANEGGSLFTPMFKLFAFVGDLFIKGLQKIFIGNGDIQTKAIR